MSAEEFTAWWQRETKSRVPASSAQGLGPKKSGAITRDPQGIPHVTATSEDDLFCAFGYAIAQDRMFQLDYLRRRALGTVAEIVGQEGYETDLVSRTVGLHITAEEEWTKLPEQTRRILEAYTLGVNAYLKDCREQPPIEFDLLDYFPADWRPQDSLAIEGEFRWYLTGRFPVIVIPELAKRTLGAGALFKAFLQGEADAESILPGSSGSHAGGATFTQPEQTGSNNWVVAGRHTATGKPLVASDPHIAFAAVSCWHEVHLHGAGYNVTGISYVGMPAVMFGRNEEVAWGCTNNICSLRDLYQEKTDAAHPGAFLFDGKWEPGRERTETINIKGREPIHKTIRSSRNGPLVDEILPVPERRDLSKIGPNDRGPVSLRWVGFEHGGWLDALLGMNRAKTAAEFREATRPWHVPTFCLVYADRAGDIGFQSTGRIPIRPNWDRAYRPGWDPAHQWPGLIPFEGMPAVSNPPVGWVISANNRLAHEFPYPLSGTWSSGHRGRRIRQMLEERTSDHKLTREDCVAMQQDAVSLRAVECLPKLLKLLSGSTDPQVRLAVNYLSMWDGRSEPDRVAATIFNVFFGRWCRRVTDERFSPDDANLVVAAASGVANDLLGGDPHGWFKNGACEQAAVETFCQTLTHLAQKLGPEMLDWTWGKIHKLQQKHFVATRGDLSRLLDRGQIAVRGDSTTVCNTSCDADFEAYSGAGYRLIADLADPGAGLYSVDAGAESGHPGSAHYDDQLMDWLTGGYHRIALTK